MVQLKRKTFCYNRVSDISSVLQRAYPKRMTACEIAKQTLHSLTPRDVSGTIRCSSLSDKVTIEDSYRGFMYQIRPEYLNVVIA